MGTLLTLSLKSNNLSALASHRKPLFAFLFVKKTQSVNQSTPEEIPDDVGNHQITPLPSRVVCSEEILSGQTEILIRHGSEIYRLRVTRSGKLILTK